MVLRILVVAAAAGEVVGVAVVVADGEVVGEDMVGAGAALGVVSSSEVWARRVPTREGNH